MKESPSAQRETLIQNGQVDMIVATYSITDARKEKVDFAGPYFVAGQDLLVQGRQHRHHRRRRRSERQEAVLGRRVDVRRRRSRTSTPGVQLQEYDTYSACVEALKNGAVDAVTTDDVDPRRATPRRPRASSRSSASRSPRRTTASA